MEYSSLSIKQQLSSHRVTPSPSLLYNSVSHGEGRCLLASMFAPLHVYIRKHLSFCFLFVFTVQLLMLCRSPNFRISVTIESNISPIFRLWRVRRSRRKANLIARLVPGFLVLRLFSLTPERFCFQVILLGH